MPDDALRPTRAPDLEALGKLEARVRWLAFWTIHHANQIRESRDGLKVGGHQASCASIATLMTALYFHEARPEDRISVKPHASPVFHAIQHLFGRQSVDAMKRFRAFGGAQAYPSRTKDADDVDFSTGSVGLGVSITAFAAVVRDYLKARGRLDPAFDGRMIALLGDAELDEGNVWETALQTARLKPKRLWWIVDYNRQSLDAATPDGMAARHGAMMSACGWRVIDLAHGAKRRAVFQKPGGEALRAWFDALPNADFGALTYRGAAAWRDRLDRDLTDAKARTLVDGLSDAHLTAVMGDVGGHCFESIFDAFDAANASDEPVFLIAHTVKGHGLPFAGHKDNHSGVLTGGQIADLRRDLGVAEGDEWNVFSGLDREATEDMRRSVATAPFAAERQSTAAAPLAPLRSFPEPKSRSVTSTQAAFGEVISALAKADEAFADALVTIAPDVATSTNLGGFVNRRGRFALSEEGDVSADMKIPSAQKWRAGPLGQHVELGIAEHDLFLALGAFGMAGALFGVRSVPIGTLYDPFVARGLDAFNYALYQGARFIVVGTPAGVALAPEGGAHQSVVQPMIGMGQPGLTSYEPAFADELAEILKRGAAALHADEGASLYLRLSTLGLAQPQRVDETWRDGAWEGAYWRRPPTARTQIILAYQGAVAGEAEAACALLDEDASSALLAVTSADRLHRDWRAHGRNSTIGRLLAEAPPGAALVTVIDGAPATLSWLGAVDGRRVAACGVETFGQSGDVHDLFRIHGLDAEGIVAAAASLFLI